MSPFSSPSDHHPTPITGLALPAGTVSCVLRAGGTLLMAGCALPNARVVADSPPLESGSKLCEMAARRVVLGQVGARGALFVTRLRTMWKANRLISSYPCGGSGLSLVMRRGI